MEQRDQLGELKSLMMNFSWIMMTKLKVQNSVIK